MGGLRIGSICFSTDQGLGILAKSFYDHGLVTHPVVMPHSTRENHYDWFPNGQRYSPVATSWVLESVDLMLFFETPFVWGLIDECRKRRIPTVLMPMYECEPEVLPARPDYIICPSLLDWQYYPPDKYSSTFIPVPVDVSWREDLVGKPIHAFVHNAGHGGLKGRNGTLELIQAMQYVKSPCKLIVRSQKLAHEIVRVPLKDPRISLRIGTVPYETLYGEGECLVHPTKFDGLSLPLQEAYASGMVCITGDRFPMNTWLPCEPLVSIKRYCKERVSSRCHEFDAAIYDPQDVAAKIDELYDTDCTLLSLRGKGWAEENSWEVLKPRYVSLFERLVEEKRGS